MVVVGIAVLIVVPVVTTVSMSAKPLALDRVFKRVVEVAVMPVRGDVQGDVLVDV